MMYAAAARELYNESNHQTRANILKEFRKKLRDRTPDLDVFKSGFSELQYTSTDTRNRAIVRYVLGRLDNHFRSDKVVDYDKMTVEHIYPENPAARLTDHDEIVGSIGNLIFVSEDLNGKLKNKSFAEKKVLLKKAGVPLDAVLSKAKVWTAVEIAARRDALAEIAFHKIW